MESKYEKEPLSLLDQWEPGREFSGFVSSNGLVGQNSGLNILGREPRSERDVLFIAYCDAMPATWMNFKLFRCNESTNIWRKYVLQVT